MLKKLLQLSFWFWFATNFTSLAKSFVETLVQLGLSAGGQGGNMGLLLNPSNIASMGLQATQPLVANLSRGRPDQHRDHRSSSAFVT